MFILITLIFTMATLYWVTWIAFLLIQIRSALVENTGMELSEKRKLTNAATAKLNPIQNFSAQLMVS
jgi:Na+/H+-translocating membrane pyrophosphatase